jgi:hypothetical protein
VRIEGTITVAPQATLTIEPGTVIRFARSGADPAADGALLVFGRLVARGSAERPILFVAATPGTTWQGIVFLGSDKKNLLEHCRVEGAATAVDASFTTLNLKATHLASSSTGLRCQDCLLVMAGGGAERCGVGLSLMDSETDLRDLTLNGNGRGIIAVRSSLYLAGAAVNGSEDAGVVAEGCRLTVTGSSVVDNASGLTCNGCEGSISINRIAGNRGHGVHLAKSRVRLEGNNIEHNGGNGLEVEDGAAIAWGNVLSANGGYDLLNAGGDDFRAIGNWWGGKGAAEIARRIFDRQADNRRGRVYFQPILRQRPSQAP